MFLQWKEDFNKETTISREIEITCIIRVEDKVMIMNKFCQQLKMKEIQNILKLKVIIKMEEDK